MYTHDMWMKKRRGQVGFTNEPLTKFDVSSQGGREHFKRIVTRQAWVGGQVNLAHSARSEHAQNRVTSKRGAAAQWHSVRLPTGHA
jgi:hypothetical protein